jgi:hypothetical protein
MKERSYFSLLALLAGIAVSFGVILYFLILYH